MTAMGNPTKEEVSARADAMRANLLRSIAIEQLTATLMMWMMANSARDMKYTAAREFVRAEIEKGMP